MPAKEQYYIYNPDIILNVLYCSEFNCDYFPTMAEIDRWINYVTSSWDGHLLTEILVRYSHGKATYSELSMLFGVSVPQVQGKYKRAVRLLYSQAARWARSGYRYISDSEKKKRILWNVLCKWESVSQNQSQFEIQEKRLHQSLLKQTRQQRRRKPPRTTKSP
jgi:hypothetical protein